MAWLSRYVSNDSSDLWCREIVHCDGWAVATDSRSLVAVRGVGKISSAENQAKVRTFLTMQPADCITTTLADLHLFCGVVYWEWCKECNGRGRFVSTGGLCEVCEGERRSRPAYHYEARGLIAGILCDLSRLAWSLAPELYEIGTEVRVGRSAILIGTFNVAVLILDGDGWRVIQPGLRMETPTQQQAGPFPTFHAESPFSQLWIERDDPGSRLILADWLEEMGDPYAAMLR